MDEREEFEKWVRRVNGSWAEKCLQKNPDGRYMFMQTRNDWIAWQACWLVCNPGNAKQQVHADEPSEYPDGYGDGGVND